MEGGAITGWTGVSPAASTCTNEWMGAEGSLFVLYTSGSTGSRRACMPRRRLPGLRGFTHKLIFDTTRAHLLLRADVG